MKERYIKRVRRELIIISKRLRKVIIQDLYEIFETANEHGETDAQVIIRLGNPIDYADECAVISGIDIIGIKKKWNVIRYLFIILSALMCFVLALFSYLTKIPHNTIGHAEAMTEINIHNNLILDSSAIFMIVGLALVFILLIWISKSIYRKKSNYERK